MCVGIFFTHRFAQQNFSSEMLGNCEFNIFKKLAVSCDSRDGYVERLYLVGGGVRGFGGDTRGLNRGPGFF